MKHRRGTGPIFEFSAIESGLIISSDSHVNCIFQTLLEFNARSMDNSPTTFYNVLFIPPVLKTQPPQYF